MAAYVKPSVSQPKIVAEWVSDFATKLLRPITVVVEPIECPKWNRVVAQERYDEEINRTDMMECDEHFDEGKNFVTPPEEEPLTHHSKVANSVNSLHHGVNIHTVLNRKFDTSANNSFSSNNILNMPTNNYFRSIEGVDLEEISLRKDDCQASWVHGLHSKLNPPLVRHYDSFVPAPHCSLNLAYKEIPADLAYIILDYMKPYETATIGRVSRCWRVLAIDPSRWQKYCFTYHPLQWPNANRYLHWVFASLNSPTTRLGLHPLLGPTAKNLQNNLIGALDHPPVVVSDSLRWRLLFAIFKSIDSAKKL
eukprot:NODE_3408_length_1357_cov_37.852512_g2970_i0.p1 GENE.NODE_3408_length_1357_cov_37.852512_g2970_i0~~NODE_3408_length_1357_cov_37.852512_g2970_i0.p1  ORF type:complete len:351 (+),score=53.17 NODE_3408_length_1357_cov_37.852512_g2970_i0:131-1054(+)